MPKIMTFEEWLDYNPDLVAKITEDCVFCDELICSDCWEEMKAIYEEAKEKEIELWSYWHKPFQEKMGGGRECLIYM